MCIYVCVYVYENKNTNFAVCVCFSVSNRVMLLFPLKQLVKLTIVTCQQAP